MTKRSYYQRKKGLIHQKINDEFIVIDPFLGTYFQLNETAEVIYKFLWKKRSLIEVAKKITEKFNVGKQHALKDTKKFINMLLEENLIIYS